ncbi:hypothetical protein ACWFN4_30040, partial [Bacillus mycoides]
QEALAPMGLPVSAEERVSQYMALHPEEPHRPGAQTPMSHPWTTVGAGSPVKGGIAPEGLATWMTLKLGTEQKSPRLTVSIPEYDKRLGKTTTTGPGGFGGAPTPAVMLDALMVYLLSTVHGPADQPAVVPYYMSPNKTGEDFAGGRGRTDVLCRTVRRGEIAPAATTKHTLVNQQWSRTPDLSEGELLHRFDKNAAWLGAFKTKLGIGEPVHQENGRPFDKALVGYWRIAKTPGPGISGLPEFVFRPASEGGFWLTTPDMILLADIYPTWEPEVLESWHWEHSKSALEGMYDKLRESRNRIIAAAKDGRPGAKWAKQVNGKIYQSFRGYLDRGAGPQKDHVTGGDYEADIYYRPDWAHMILSHATANVYRNLKKFAEDDGRLPVSVYVDAVTYASNQLDPMAAKPASMLIGDTGREWGIEGVAPIAELLPHVDDSKGLTIHNVLTNHLKSKGK